MGGRIKGPVIVFFARRVPRAVKCHSAVSFRRTKHRADDLRFWHGRAGPSWDAYTDLARCTPATASVDGDAA